MEERFQLALQVAGKSAAFLKKAATNPGYLRSPAYDIKLRQDVESETIILNAVEKKFPGDGYLSEERGGRKGSSGYTWLIDPLDGTVNYARGMSHASVSIACRRDGRTVFGVVQDIFTGEVFTGKLGQGAFLNGKKIRPSRTRKLQEAIVAFGLMKGRLEIKKGLEILTSLAEKVRKVRVLGSAALDICYVACGRLDAFFELSLNEWDTAAAGLILEEAGGNFQEEYHAGIKYVFGTNGHPGILIPRPEL